MKRKLMLLLTCLFVGIGLVTAQTQRVTGNVTSEEDGLPVVGASVLVKGTTVGTITDIDGNFTLSSVPASAKVLQVSYIGMQSQEVAIKPSVKIILKNDAKALDEVVVTALGISREKKSLGYSVSEVKGDELLKSRGGVSNPVNALQGKVAGLQIAGGSGNMGGSSKVLIRGVSSLSGNNQPLFIIDGVPIEGGDYNSADTQRGAGGYDYGNLIQDINPDDIESLSVLKGANASALYGSRASNGVIMITTKKGKKGEGYGVTFSSSVGFEVVNKLPQMQKLYGGGYGSKFKQVTINGKAYNYPDYATDESWGLNTKGNQFLVGMI
ncbi:carboxypeptidase-like regulatory domain-containing protein [Bacteroides graminisolvens]|uniref:carboxypeptidase-like regulatory domain-containing protein n=1 Tax=Bacteroides graminisolvens TaxID=477666 RepID=UPI0029C60B4E|nr:carboxypeptidase-like regulatory domain-containing protein [Bacteroides graminisolvens]